MFLLTITIACIPISEIKDLQSSQVLAVGKVIAGLYIIDSASFTPEILQSFSDLPKHLNTLASCNLASPIFSWHHRLGHPSYVVANHLDSFIPANVLDHHVSPCDVRRQSKQCRLSFPLSTVNSNFIFQLLRMDGCMVSL
ncbi:hypothetical protein Sjap_014899 [Stephania japonica]|uniref:GAG-pre-integrase domain-containing protein n=1 Tax=Stephania japonica TaxID=461633 RepID=A0AAP0IK08_9MAGN